MKTAIEEVLDEAVERYREELANALQESLNLLREALGRAEYEKGRIISRAKEEGERAYRHYVMQAELESRGMVLRTFEEILNELVDAAIRELENVDRERYYRSIKSLLLEAINVIGSSEPEVRPSRKDAKLIKSLCEEVEKEKGVKLSISKERVESEHGFIMTSKDGKVVIDCTIGALKERLMPLIRRRVAEKYLKQVV